MSTLSFTPHSFPESPPTVPLNMGSSSMTSLTASTTHHIPLYPITLLIHTHVPSHTITSQPSLSLPHFLTHHHISALTVTPSLPHTPIHLLPLTFTSQLSHSLSHPHTTPFTCRSRLVCSASLLLPSCTRENKRDCQSTESSLTSTPCIYRLLYT